MVERGTEGPAEHGLGVAWPTAERIGHDVSARHSAGVCWHSIRPLPRGSVRSKVVPRRNCITYVLDAMHQGRFFVEIHRKGALQP